MAIGIEVKVDNSTSHNGKLWAAEFNALTGVVELPILAVGDRRALPVGRRDQILGAIDDINRLGLFKYTDGSITRFGELKGDDGNDIAVFKTGDIIPLYFEKAFEGDPNTSLLDTIGYTFVPLEGDIADVGIPPACIVHVVIDTTSKTLTLLKPNSSDFNRNLTSIDNLDNIVTPGTYYAKDSDDPDENKDYPTDSSGTLTVSMIGDVLTQNYYADVGILFLRHKDENGEWTPWVSTAQLEEDILVNTMNNLTVSINNSIKIIDLELAGIHTRTVEDFTTLIDIIKRSIDIEIKTRLNNDKEMSERIEEIQEENEIKLLEIKTEMKEELASITTTLLTTTELAITNATAILNSELN